jgi:hypothetical protein
MHIHLPKPAHGWREFAGEVGIIVIGVLIALGAEQVIESLHWRHQVGEFRTAVRQEVSYDLATYDYRNKENDCVKARLDQLEAWSAGWQNGTPTSLTGQIGSPISLSLNTAAWESRDANLVSHMPIEERMALGYLYDEFANNDSHRLDERQAWLELAKFDGALDLDRRDLMELRGLITRARYRDERMTANAASFFQTAAAMGIRPQAFGFPALEPSFCEPIFQQRHGTART